MVRHHHGVVESQSGQDERVLGTVEVNYVETAPDKAVCRGRKVHTRLVPAVCRGT